MATQCCVCSSLHFKLTSDLIYIGLITIKRTCVRIFQPVNRLTVSWTDGRTFFVHLHSQHYSDMYHKDVSLFLTKHHALKAYWESGGIAPRILKLGTGYR
jgi:hypothetical protein